jgi:hypothetical protein
MFVRGCPLTPCFTNTRESSGLMPVARPRNVRPNPERIRGLARPRRGGDRMVELAASENVDRIRVQVFVRDPHEAPWTATSWHNIGWRRYVASLWNRLFFGTVQSPGIWFQVCPRIFCCSTCCSKNTDLLLSEGTNALLLQARTDNGVVSEVRDVPGSRQKSYRCSHVLMSNQKFHMR